MVLVSGESEMHVMCAGRGMCSVVLTGMLMQRLGMLESAASASEVVVDEATALNLGSGWKMEKIQDKEAYRLRGTIWNYVTPKRMEDAMKHQEACINDMLEFAPGCVSM